MMTPSKALPFEYGDELFLRDERLEVVGLRARFELVPENGNLLLLD
jgi:hypothetical protein